MTQTMTSQAPPSTRAATSAPPPATPSTDPARYIPPQSGLLSLVPSTWIPFIELARLDKPVGFLYLYFPCLAATFVAALLAKSKIPPSDLFVVNILLLASSVVMRVPDVHGTTSSTRNSTARSHALGSALLLVELSQLHLPTFSLCSWCSFSLDCRHSYHFGQQKLHGNRAFSSAYLSFWQPRSIRFPSGSPTIHKSS